MTTEPVQNEFVMDVLYGRWAIRFTTVLYRDEKMGYFVDVPDLKNQIMMKMPGVGIPVNG